MERWSYMIQLCGWAGPVILVQWLLFGKVFRRNELCLTVPTLIGGTYFTAADFFAIRFGIRTFDPAKILGIKLGVIPIEEVLFFYLACLLIAQTYILLLPKYLRR